MYALYVQHTKGTIFFIDLGHFFAGRFLGNQNDKVGFLKFFSCPAEALAKEDTVSQKFLQREFLILMFLMFPQGT